MSISYVVLTSQNYAKIAQQAGPSGYAFWLVSGKCGSNFGTEVPKAGVISKGFPYLNSSQGTPTVDRQVTVRTDRQTELSKVLTANVASIHQLSLWEIWPTSTYTDTVCKCIVL